jgi:fluoride exporter
MLKNLFLVGFGGAAGSMLRFLFGIWFKHSSFPLATLLVNIIGSFVIGMVIAFSLRNNTFEANWKLLLATGLCGGFTTFSAFSAEGLQMLQQQRYGILILYVAGSILLGLLATWLGFSIAK